MKRESLIDRVYRYCDSHFKEGRKVVVNHFLKENHPRASIYRYISMWQKCKSKLRVVGSDRKAKIMTKTNITKLQSMIGNIGFSHYFRWLFWHFHPTNCSKAQVQPISRCVYNSATHKYCLPKKTDHSSLYS